MKKVMKAGVFIYTITKRDSPVARLAPIEDKPISLFGSMKGTLRVHGDLLSPIDEEWDAAR